MSQSRREFLITSAAALAAVATVNLSASPPDQADAFGEPEPAWIHGDPYTASACGGGLGGRSFEASRAQALRFRMPAEERDRYVLGLEF